MKPYDHPWRLSAAATWRIQPTLRLDTKIAAGLVVFGGATAIVTGPFGLLVAMAGVTLALWVAVILGLATVRNTLWLLRSWRRPSDLAAVRARRPHAGEADPELAHDEFAVSVEEDGWLVTWRFRPLAIHENPTKDEVEVPGRPCYAAQAVDDRAFDAADVSRAAEQLVAAQERAADRERAAAQTAHSVVADAARRAELLAETRSTAAALQRATGQRSRRDD